MSDEERKRGQQCLRVARETLKRIEDLMSENDRKRDLEYLRFGRELVRMIGELQTLSEDDTGYSKRQFTFPGGSVFLLLVKDEALVETMERAVQEGYAVAEATPPRALN